MLKKLFKYEWKDVWKPLGILNIAVLLLSAISCFTFSEDFLELADSNEYVAILFGFYNLLYVGAIMALGFATTFYLIYRFYKNLYTDEGYLMHTLPVKPGELIWSKAFVAVIWSAISSLVITLSLMIYVNSIMIGDGEPSIWSGFAELFDQLSMLHIDGSAVVMIIIMVLILLVTPFYTVLFGYTAVSFGQRAKKHKILATIGFYVVISYGIQIVVSLVTVPVLTILENLTTTIVESWGYSEYEGILMAVNGSLVLTLLVIAGITTGFYFIVNNIMKTKLNLE